MCNDIWKNKFEKLYSIRAIIIRKFLIKVQFTLNIWIVGPSSVHCWETIKGNWVLQKHKINHLGM